MKGNEENNPELKIRWKNTINFLSTKEDFH